MSLFWCALLCVLFSFAIILRRKRELFALLLLSYGCLVSVNVMWLFLNVPWVGLQCVIVVFPDHLRNKFDFWNVHGIMNTSGLLQIKSRPKGFTITLQETRSIHDSINRPKNKFIA